ncbi:UNVERIFIED_CONTAM: gem (nuclear organelle) associated protein 2 [Siphonaria sp. JEL0065]|nr:gem (nuclear organelle) associated protein 2 [Siphonaria sp. JEL0065]
MSAQINSTLIPDPEEGLRRRCLPINDYLRASDPLEINAVPVDGLEYLRLVRHQAQFECSAVVWATTDRKRAYETAEAAGPKKRNRLRADFDSADPVFLVPRRLLQTAPVRASIVAEFANLKSDVLARQAAAKRYAVVPPFALPSHDASEHAWKAFCYPSLPCFNAATSNIPASTLPLMPILTYLDHNRAIQLLKFHIRWITSHSTIDVISTQLHWIFMLLACLDTPLFPDHSSILRDLVRKLQSIRNTWIQAGAFDSLKSRVQIDSDARVVGIASIVAVVAGVFGQADLSDQVRDERDENDQLHPNDIHMDHENDIQQVRQETETGEEEDGELESSVHAMDQDNEFTTRQGYQEFVEESQMFGDERYF